MTRLLLIAVLLAGCATSAEEVREADMMDQRCWNKYHRMVQNRDDYETVDIAKQKQRCLAWDREADRRAEDYDMYGSKPSVGSAVAAGVFTSLGNAGAVLANPRQTSTSCNTTQAGGTSWTNCTSQ